jgi:hypothetical protein
MKTIVVESRSGKPVPIGCLTGFDLIYGLPVFLLNLLNFYVVFPVLGFVSGILGAPAARVMGQPYAVRLPMLRLAIVGYMLLLPLAYAAHLWAPDLPTAVRALFALLLGLLGVAVGRTLVFANNIEGQPISFRTGTRDAIGEQAARIPLHLLDHPLSRGALLSAMLLSVFVAYNLAYLTILSNVTWLYVVPFVVLLQCLLFANKEHIEHLCSHAGGSVLRIRNARSLRDLPYVVAGLLRRFLVWPMHLWMPNYYLCTHAGIHHVEDNGPADFQSTLRFDKSSFLDFIHAVTWHSLFIAVVPIDIIRYLLALKRYRLLRVYLRGLFFGWLVFGIVSWMHPALGLLLLLTHIASGMDNYLTIMRWHGFQDARVPYSVRASNNSRRHYRHHTQPVEHLMAPEAAGNDPVTDERNDPAPAPLFMSDLALDVYTRNAMFIFFLLWQKKYAVLGPLITGTQGAWMERAEALVHGLRLVPLNSQWQALDDRLSLAMGRAQQVRHGRFVTPDDDLFLRGQPEAAAPHPEEAAAAERALP